MESSYKLKKKLGRGSFGDVFLVEDEYHWVYAMKEIPLKNLEIKEYKTFYFQEEMKAIKELNHPYIVKQYQIEQTQKMIRILFEYCDGGDLQKIQRQKQQKVFTLKEAINILMNVIEGIKHIHQRGYIHRDIKLQNILMKNEDEEEVKIIQMKVYKISDLGFCKKANKTATVLGTQIYMAPQIFQGLQYGKSVDMWAFGVMFYYMLNQQYPFCKVYIILEMNPHSSFKAKIELLSSQAKNFSFKKKVTKSKLKKQQNCSEQIEDLFSKIFQIDPLKRISFQQICAHQVFAQGFSDAVKVQSKILYSKKYRNYSKEKRIVQGINEKIEFLYFIFEEFKKLKGVLKIIDKILFDYCLLKYYLILKNEQLRILRKKSFIKEIDSSHRHNLMDYVETNDYFKYVEELSQDLQSKKTKFDFISEECQSCINEIDEINKQFKKLFSLQVPLEKFKDPFQTCFKITMNHIYKKIRIKYKQNKKQYSYFILLIIICHTFNDILQNKGFQELIHEFFQEKQVDIFNLKKKLPQQNPESMITISKHLIAKYEI